jgi:hypothetical protein
VPITKADGNALPPAKAATQQGTRPGDQFGRRISVFTKPRDSVASGQLAANQSAAA